MAKFYSKYKKGLGKWKQLSFTSSRILVGLCIIRVGGWWVRMYSLRNTATLCQKIKSTKESWDIIHYFFLYLTLSILCFVHPLSYSQSPCYYRHIISAHFCSRSHDVPKPPCSDVRLSPHADGWRPGCAQRLLPGRLGYAGVPRTGPGYRSEYTQCLCLYHTAVKKKTCLLYYIILMRIIFITLDHLYYCISYSVI